MLEDIRQIQWDALDTIDAWQREHNLTSSTVINGVTLLAEVLSSRSELPLVLNLGKTCSNQASSHLTQLRGPSVRASWEMQLRGESREQK